MTITRSVGEEEIRFNADGRKSKYENVVLFVMYAIDPLTALLVSASGQLPAMFSSCFLSISDHRVDVSMFAFCFRTFPRRRRATRADLVGQVQEWDVGRKRGDKRRRWRAGGNRGRII